MSTSLLAQFTRTMVKSVHSVWMGCPPQHTPPHTHPHWKIYNINNHTQLWYVSWKAIFGAWMGRDDGYYCGVLSSGVNLFLVKGSSFYFTHWSFIVRGILAASCQLLYQVTYTMHRPTLLPTTNIYKVAIFNATLKRKTRVEPLAYHSISKGFEMVACDVGILYCVVLSL